MYFIVSSDTNENWDGLIKTYPFEWCRIIEVLQSICNITSLYLHNHDLIAYIPKRRVQLHPIN